MKKEIYLATSFIKTFLSFFFLFFLSINGLADAEVGFTDESTETILKKLCLTSNPSWEEAARKDYLTQEEYSKLYPQKRTLVACHGYFIFGGRDLKAIDRIFESFHFLMTEDEEVKDLEVFEELLTLAREYKGKVLSASETIYFLSQNEEEKRENLKILINSNHSRTISSLLSLTEEHYVSYKIADLISKEDLIKKGIEHEIPHVVNLSIFQLAELEAHKENVFLYPKSTLKVMLEDKRFYFFHDWLHAYFYKSGNFESAYLQKIIHALKGNDVDKLYAAHAFSLSTQNWKHGYIAQQILQLIKDEVLIKEDEELQTIWLDTQFLIRANSVFKSPKKTFDSSSTYDPLIARFYFPESYKKSAIDLYGLNELEKDLEKYELAYEKAFIEITELTGLEKYYAGSYALFSQDKILIDKGVALILDASAEIGTPFTPIFKYANDINLAPQQNNNLSNSLYKLFLDENDYAEEAILFICEQSHLLIQHINCDDFYKKSILAKVTRLQDKVFTEESLTRQEIRFLENYQSNILSNKARKYNILADYYYFQREDIDTAIYYYRKASDLGDGLALNALANLLTQKGKYNEALSTLQLVLLEGDFNHNSAQIISTTLREPNLDKLEERYLWGNYESWEEIAFDLGNSSAGLDIIYRGLGKHQEYPFLEEKIYQLDLLQRNDFQALSDINYYGARTDIAFTRGNLSEGKIYLEALKDLCTTKQCINLESNLELQLDRLVDDKEVLYSKLKRMGEDFLYNNKDLDIDEWTWTVYDSEIYQLEELFINIIRKIHKDGSYKDLYRNYLTFYMFIAWRADSCENYLEVMQYIRKYEEIVEEDFWLFEMYFTNLAWGSSCNQLDQAYFSFLAYVVETVFDTYLDTGNLSVAAKAIKILYKESFKDQAFFMGIRLIEELKKQKTLSIVTGQEPSFSDQNKSLSFYRFFSDLLFERYEKGFLDEDLFLNLALEINSLSGFSSIAQTMFNKRAADVIKSEEFRESLENLKKTRKSLDESKIHGVNISTEQMNRLLLNLSKYKKSLRKVLEGDKAKNLYPTKLLSLVKSNLRDNEVLLLFLQGNNQTYRFSLSKNESNVALINESRLSVWQQVKASLTQVNASKELPRTLLELSTDLLPKGIEKYKYTSFIPSSNLLGFPFKALTLQNVKSLDPIEISKEKNFLIQRNSLRIVPSILDFIYKEKRKHKSKNLLAFANPLFNSLSLKETDILLNKFRSSASTLSSIESLSPLPESEEEVRNISKLFRESLIFVGEESSIDNFQNLDLSNFSHIVFASHAIKPNEIEGFISSGIVLSPSEDNLGLLTPYMVSNLELSADLVSLSACSTSSSEYEKGEVYTGLVKSFFDAGAKAVLFTDWKVETNTAAFINEKTFKYLMTGLDEDEALTLALRDHLEETDHYFKHPAFWASFNILF